MPVNDVVTDTDALTLTITSAFDAPVERVWRLWSDPRQLERWWGPPTYPATVVEHALEPGAETRYFMTGPEGDRHHGWWEVLEVQEPRRLRFLDGFADDEGNRNDEMPAMTVTVTLDAAGDRTTMTIESRWDSREAMDRVIEMGAVEGMTQALGQIDALLVEE